MARRGQRRTGCQRTADRCCCAQRGSPKAQREIGAVACVKAKGMKEAWCLTTSHGDKTGAEIVKLYGKRFTIEDSFRDQKNLRFGMGLSETRIGSPERRDRMLLVSAIAIALLTILGAAGEAIGIDKYLKTNTVKTRTISLLNQGLMHYAATPEDEARARRSPHGQVRRDAPRAPGLPRRLRTHLNEGMAQRHPFCAAGAQAHNGDRDHQQEKLAGRSAEPVLLTEDIAAVESEIVPFHARRTTSPGAEWASMGESAPNGDNVSRSDCKRLALPSSPALAPCTCRRGGSCRVEGPVRRVGAAVFVFALGPWLARCSSGSRARRTRPPPPAPPLRCLA
jgi:hypothetical protein